MIEHTQSLRLFYVLSFLMWASQACAETIDVSSTQRMNSLVTSEFKYLEDISGDITLQDVMRRNDDAHWTDIDTASISFGFTN